MAQELKPGDRVMLSPNYAKIIQNQHLYSIIDVEHWLSSDRISFNVEYTVATVTNERAIQLKEVAKGFNHPMMIFRKVNDSVEHEDNLINIWNNQ